MTPTKITTSLEKFYEARKNEAERETIGLFNLANIFYDELSIQFSMLGLNLNDYFRDDLDYTDILLSLIKHCLIDTCKHLLS